MATVATEHALPSTARNGHARPQLSFLFFFLSFIHYHLIGKLVNFTAEQDTVMHERTVCTRITYDHYKTIATETSRTTLSRVRTSAKARQYHSIQSNLSQIKPTAVCGTLNSTIPYAQLCNYNPAKLLE